MWNQHLDDVGRSPDVADQFQEFEDEHQEPVARAERQRELTIRRHKDLTQEDIDLSKKLWQWGFAFLPFLWLVNYVFFRHALTQPTTPDEMKRNIRRSLMAFVIAITIWISWLIIFYTNMNDWAHPLLIFSPQTQVLRQ